MIRRHASEFRTDSEYENYLSDLESARIDAMADKTNEDFLEFCRDNDMDPEEDDAWYWYKDALEYAEDPYKYNGLSMRDFL